jgi:hypothetical protein
MRIKVDIREQHGEAMDCFVAGARRNDVARAESIA